MYSSNWASSSGSTGSSGFFLFHFHQQKQKKKKKKKRTDDVGDGLADSLVSGETEAKDLEEGKAVGEFVALTVLGVVDLKAVVRLKTLKSDGQRVDLFASGAVSRDFLLQEVTEAENQLLNQVAHLCRRGACMTVGVVEGVWGEVLLLFAPVCVDDATKKKKNEKKSCVFASWFLSLLLVVCFR